MRYCINSVAINIKLEILENIGYNVIKFTLL